MSLDNYHLSFLKSLYSADSGVGAQNGFGLSASTTLHSTESSPTNAAATIESLLEPFGLQGGQDFAVTLAQLTGQSAKQMDRQQSSNAVQRPTSFTTSSLFSNTLSDFGNPLGAPGTPINSQQMSVGHHSPYSSAHQTPLATPNGNGTNSPKNPKLYKTELCRSWMDHGRCNYGERCQYAHGELEKRAVPRHPKYKTEACQSFHQSGYCPYGPRCHFIHNEAPGTPQSQYSTPVSTAVAQPTTPSLYASQYHNMSMKQQSSGMPNPALQRVYSLPNGGYGSAGESPTCSSNDSGSESPNGSFSPGLDLDDNGPFSSGFLSAAPHKMHQQQSTKSAAPRSQSNRFLSYDQSSINDAQFSNMLNDLYQWNLNETLTYPGLSTSKWSASSEEATSPVTTSTPGRLPVFAQLSNPQ